MRLAPVPAAFVEQGLDTVIERSLESSLPTHRAPQALSTCAYLGALLASLMTRSERNVVLSPDWPMLDRLRENTLLHPAIAEVAARSFRREEPPAIRGSGPCRRVARRRLWAFARADIFHDAVLAAVDLGDDADTTGAVCGQIAGAYWGLDGIPEEWRSGPARREMVDRVAAGLASI